MTDTSSLIEKGQAVLATVREEAPVLKEAVSELPSEPQNAFAKLLAVLKDIWAKILQVGFIASIIDFFKKLCGSAASSVSARAATVIPNASAAAPPAVQDAGKAKDAPVAAGEETPLLDRDDAPDV